MLATQAPFSQYFDKNGDPLDAGYVYFGQPNQNPETVPIPAFWDIGGTQPIAQPARTLAGYIVRNGTPARVYVAGAYSVTVRNRKGEMVYYAATSEDFSNQPVNRAIVTATNGQTVITVPFAYTRGNNSLQVFVNGLIVRGSSIDYTETTTTSITFVNGLSAGDEVELMGGVLLNPVNALGMVSDVALASVDGASLVGYSGSSVYPENTVGYAIQQGVASGDYIGAWDADTNDPTLTSGVGVTGAFYIVNVAGTTTLDGISSWSVGDQVRFDGSAWQKIPAVGGSAAVDVTFTPPVGMVETNVQAAIEEVNYPPLPVAPTYLQTISQIMQGERVSLWRFLINGQDAGAQTLINNFRSGTVSTDYTTQIQEAFDAAELNAYELYVPPVWGSYRTTAQLRMSYSMKVSGTTCEPYIDAPNRTKGRGSWFYFDHTGVGILVFGEGGLPMSGLTLDGIGTVRNQPTPSNTPGTPWTPTANDYDLYIANTDAVLSNLMLWNPTKAIRHNFGGYGKVTTTNVRGQPLQYGFRVDLSTDTCHFTGTHWWVFWSDNSNVVDYMKANAYGMYLCRCDNPQIQDYFTWGMNRSLAISPEGGLGNTSFCMMSNFGFDNVGAEAIIILPGADGATGQFTNGYAVDGARAILNLADNVRLKVVNFRGASQTNEVIQSTTAGSTIQCTNLELQSWDTDTTGASALSATGGSKITVGDELVLTNATGLNVVAGNVWSYEWRDYATVPTPATGSFGVGASATARYQTAPGKVTATFIVTIPLLGGGGSAVVVPLPVDVKASQNWLFSGSNITTAAAVKGTAVGSNLTIELPNGGMPITGNAQVIIISGDYEPA